MPTYTYRCKDCGHQFDKHQRMAEEPLTECPMCDGRIRRVLNSVGIVFKGSGFYVTDNRNGSSANGSGKSASNGSGEKTEKKTETTSAETKSDEKAKSATKPKSEKSAAAAAN